MIIKSKKISVLSKNSNISFNRWLKEEGGKTGLDVQVINPFECILMHNNVIHKGKPVDRPDAVILRTPPYREDREYFHTLAGVFELKGVPVINPLRAVNVTGNKFATTSILEEHGLPVLPSVGIKKIDHVDEAVKAVGGYPVFLKTLRGTRGIGVMYCNNRETLRACAQTMWAYGANLMVERFARSSGGRTVRVFIFWDEIIGAVQCSPMEKEVAGVGEETLLRSNFSRGGALKPYIPDDEQLEMSLKACRTIGLKMAGVDLVCDGSEWNILEINSSPGIKGLTVATGENVAAKIAKIIIDRLG